MPKNKGFINENEFRKYFNNIEFNALNENMKRFILFLTDGKVPKEKIKSEKPKTQNKINPKPDVILFIDNKKYPISLKMGSGDSVHQESLNNFITFLSALDFSKTDLNLLREYHWSDGTLDNTGKIRISATEYKKNNPEKIIQLNNKFNKPIKYRNLILRRILFDGIDKSNDSAAYVYHGTIVKGLWASREELLKYPTTENKNSVHVSFATYQTWNKCLNKNPKTESRRLELQFKVGGLEKILKEIRGLKNEK